LPTESRGSRLLEAEHAGSPCAPVTIPLAAVRMPARAQMCAPRTFGVPARPRERRAGPRCAARAPWTVQSAARPPDVPP